MAYRKYKRKEERKTLHEAALIIRCDGEDIIHHHSSCCYYYYYSTTHPTSNHHHHHQSPAGTSALPNTVRPMYLHTERSDNKRRDEEREKRKGRRRTDVLFGTVPLLRVLTPETPPIQGEGATRHWKVPSTCSAFSASAGTCHDKVTSHHTQTPPNKTC